MTTTRGTQIRAFLEKWANSETSPHFAVMIEGDWGCGKTHFVNNLIEEDGKFAQRKAIYLSTFGFSNSQALETSLFYASMSDTAKWAHKGVGLAGPILSGVLTIGSGGFGGSADLTKVAKSVTCYIEQSFKSLDRAVLILDDLERCPIPMAELLGVVNRYVEHGDTRVILVANTEKIKDKDNDFTSFRDKVVGHSFRFVSDPDDALASFIEEIGNPEVRTIIEGRSDQIRKLYDLSGYHNLRALRQFIWHLRGIVTKLDEQYRKNELLIESLIFQAFIFFTEFKLDLSGESKALTPRNLCDTYLPHKLNIRYVYELSSDEKKEPTPKKKVLSKYKTRNGIHTVVTVGQWISILETGLVNQEWLNKEIAGSNEVAKSSALPSWQRLWYFLDWDLSDGSDEEFWATLADLNKRLDEGQYRHPAEFLSVAGVLLMLSKYGLHKTSVPETVERLKTYVDCHLIPALTYETYKEFKNDTDYHSSYQGLGYMNKDDPEFQKGVCSHLKERMDGWYAEWLEKSAGVELLSCLPGDLQRFLGNITSIGGAPEHRHRNEPILHTIEPEKFVNAWFRLPRSDERSFVVEIGDRYNRCPTAWELEGPWWREIQQELKSRMDAEQVEPRAVQIDFLIKDIDKIILEQSGKAGG